jgi:pilus assembly protein CpaB
MLQQRSLIVIGLAIMFGLAAVFLANTYLSGVQKQQEVVPTGTAKVVVARVPMDFGTEITADKVRLVNLPIGAVPEGAFNWPGQLTPGGKARVALRQIAINEPILRTAVSGEGGRASISAVLKEDMRAIAVRVSDVAGVAGFILPGDTVDVMVTRPITNGNSNEQQQITDVLLQKVRVLAIDQNASQIAKDPAVGKTATLEVNQIDAQRLTLGQQVGTIHLVLRRVEDQDNPMVATVGLEDLRDNAYSGGFRAPGPQYRPSFMNGGNRQAAVVPPSPKIDDIFTRTTTALSKAFGAPAPAAAAPKQTGPMMPAKPKGPTVEIVRGTTGTTYEVGANVRF